MNLCIDKGNSRTKIGLFDFDQLREVKIFSEFGREEVTALLENFFVENAIISNVAECDIEWSVYLKQSVKNYIELSHTTPVPIKNLYSTPETLGKDRLAAVVGAFANSPYSDALVIDAGTAITYDFIDAGGNYHGGNISPGLQIRFRALHDYTKRLPVVELQDNIFFLGNDTSSAILSGVVNGMIYEINGYINQLKINYPQLLIYLTGGDAFYFATKLKSPIFAENNLVLTGLNRILNYNV